jgi:hypothetical protein
LNHIQEHNDAEKQEPKTTNLTEKVKKVAEYDFRLNKEQLINLAPFYSFCILLLFIFIAYTHKAEKTIRQTEKLKREVKELRTQYISTLTLLMSESKQSTVAKKLVPFGIKELKTPPRKITHNNGN